METIEVRIRFTKVGDAAPHREIKRTVETPAPFTTSPFVDAVLNYPRANSTHIVIIKLDGEFAAEPTEEQITQAVIAAGTARREEQRRSAEQAAAEERRRIEESLQNGLKDELSSCSWPGTTFEKLDDVYVSDRWYRKWKLSDQGRAVAKELGILDELEKKIAESNDLFAKMVVEKERLKALAAQQRQEREAQVAREKEESQKEAENWIREYGSERLRRLFDQGYTWSRLYVEERMHRDLSPDVIFFSSIEEDTNGAKTPSLAALKLEAEYDKRLEELGNPDRVSIIRDNEGNEYLYFHFQPGKLGKAYEQIVCIAVPDPS